MRTDWEINKLGDLCEFVRGPFGGSLKKNIFKKDGYAIYEQQHAIYDQFSDVRYFIDEKKFSEMRRFELSEGDLIMSCSGTMGKVAIVPSKIKKGIINQALLKLTPSKKISAKYLKLFMSSENFQQSLKEFSLGAAIQNVASVKVLKQIPILTPPLHEQQRIVSILDEAFSAIAKAKANAERNLQNAKELFDSYVESVFVNTEVSWEEKRLAEICHKITDGTHQTPTYFEKGVIFLSSRNVVTGKINWDKIKFIDNKQHLEMQKRVSPKMNDILLAKNGTTGVAALVDRDVKFDIYVSLALLRPLEVISPQLLLYFINSPVAKRQFNKRLKGMGVPNLHLEEIREVVIRFPKSEKTQRELVYKFDSLSTEIKKLESIYQMKLRNLEDLKNSVLQKAFKGELKTMVKELA